MCITLARSLRSLRLMVDVREIYIRILMDMNEISRTIEFKDGDDWWRDTLKTSIDDNADSGAYYEPWIVI